MALTAAQKLAVKKHLEVPPTSTIIDSLISVVEADVTLETELGTALTAATTARTNWETAMTNSDEITEGEGAKFNHNRNISIKKQAYKAAVKYLTQLLEFPMPGEDSMLTGFFVS